MTATNLERSITLVFGHEGGYVNNPKDPGGPTKYGITQRTLKAWRGKAVSVADVKALTLSEASQILRKQYWAPVKGDELPAGLDHAVFDYSTNSGPSQAMKTLQRIVGVVADGIIGARTLAAVAAWDVHKLIQRLCDARLAFLNQLKTWKTFGKGWAIRVERVRKEAIAISGGKTPACVAGCPVGLEQANPDDIKLLATDNGQTAVASVGATVGAVGVAASTVADKIAPYADIPAVKYIFITLVVVGAAATAFVAIRGLLAGRNDGEFA